MRTIQYRNRINEHTSGVHSFAFHIISIYIYIYIYIYMRMWWIGKQCNISINQEAQKIAETPHDNEIGKWGHNTVSGAITFSIYQLGRWLLPVENHNENSETTLTEERAYMWRPLDASTCHQVLWVSCGWKNKNVQFVRSFAPSLRHWESFVAKRMYISRPSEMQYLSDTESLS
jgi:hypothetical protein